LETFALLLPSQTCGDSYGKDWHETSFTLDLQPCAHGGRDLIRVIGYHTSISVSDQLGRNTSRKPKHQDRASYTQVLEQLPGIYATLTRVVPHKEKQYIGTLLERQGLGMGELWATTNQMLNTVTLCGIFNELHVVPVELDQDLFRAEPHGSKGYKEWFWVPFSFVNPAGIKDSERQTRV